MSQPTGQVWFTADEHYGHRRIVELAERPFVSVEEMDEVLISRHNAVVGPDDVTFHLGDFALGDRARGLGYLSRLAGRHVLVVGNHEKCFGGNPNGWRYRVEYTDAGFDAVLDVAVVKLPPTRRDRPGREVLLSHFPYARDHRDRVRFAHLRPADTGMWLVHGHVHGAYTVADRGVNVGVDRWDYAPVPATRVAELIDDVEAGRLGDH